MSQTSQKLEALARKASDLQRDMDKHHQESKSLAKRAFRVHSEAHNLVTEIIQNRAGEVPRSQMLQLMRIHAASQTARHAADEAYSTTGNAYSRIEETARETASATTQKAPE